MPCSNSHFPRALLHGSVLLGGIGIPTQTHKTTKDRLKYFLYNVRRPSITRDKLEASILFTQLKVGTSRLFFLCSYNQYWLQCLLQFKFGVNVNPSGSNFMQLSLLSGCHLPSLQTMFSSWIWPHNFTIKKDQI